MGDIDRVEKTFDRLAGFYKSLQLVWGIITGASVAVGAIMGYVAHTFGEAWTLVSAGFFLSVIVWCAVSAFIYSRVRPVWGKAVMDGVNDELERLYPISNGVNLDVSQWQPQGDGTGFITLLASVDRPYEVRLCHPSFDEYVEATLNGDPVIIEACQPLARTPSIPPRSDMPLPMAQLRIRTVGSGNLRIRYKIACDSSLNKTPELPIRVVEVSI